eukprot:9967406-Ditylum_brightwellii.AAC.1
MPEHTVMKELNMVHNNFLFVWNNVHAYDEEDMNMEAEEEEDNNEESADSSEIVKFIMEKDQQDQNNATSNYDNEKKY